LGGVVAQGARRIASATRRLVVQGAVQGPQTAVRGVTGIGTSVAQELTRFAGRVGDKAVRASQSALRGLTRGERGEPVAAETRLPEGEMPNDPAVARESVRFWERVAEFFGA